MQRFTPLDLNVHSNMVTLFLAVSYLLLSLLGVVHAALQVLQQVEHLLDLSLRVSLTLHHVLQLHHTLVRLFLQSAPLKTNVLNKCQLSIISTRMCFFFCSQWCS